MHSEKEEIKKEPNQEDFSVPVILVQTAFWPKKLWDPLKNVKPKHFTKYRNTKVSWENI